MGINGRLRQTILRQDGMKCRICGQGASDGASLEVDHIKPVSLGGDDDPRNLWTLCKKCNQGKSNKWDDSVKPTGQYLAIYPSGQTVKLPFYASTPLSVHCVQVAEVERGETPMLAPAIWMGPNKSDRVYMLDPRAFVWLITNGNKEIVYSPWRYALDLHTPCISQWLKHHPAWDEYAAKQKAEKKLRRQKRR